MSEDEKINKPRELIEPMIFNDDKVDKNKGLIHPMEFDVRTKSIEEKIYIILYKIIDSNNEDEYNNIYSICLGRTDAYNDIKNKLLSGEEIDIHKSKIITETKQTETESGDRKYYLVAYEDCISVYSFMISIQDYYSDDNAVEAVESPYEYAGLYDGEIYYTDGAGQKVMQPRWPASFSTLPRTLPSKSVFTSLVVKEK